MDLYHVTFQCNTVCVIEIYRKLPAIYITEVVPRMMKAYYCKLKGRCGNKIQDN